MNLTAKRWFSAQSPLWTQPLLLWVGSLLSVGVLGGVVFLWQLGDIGLVDETEPLFAEAARQMLATGDWVTPYFNGVTRFDKPPLIYWLMATAYQVLGVNEWAVRLPSAISAIATLALGFYTLRRFGFPTPKQSPAEDVRSQWYSAWIGTAVMALTPETMIWGRLGVSDMLLTGCMSTALLSFFIGYAQPEAPARQKRWYLACFGLVALAVLAKGPVGLVLPALIIGLFLACLGNLRTVLRELPLFKGIGLFMTITVPWYMLVIRANGQAYLDSFFGYHNVERFTQVVNNHTAPWYFYILVLVLGFAPWSVWLPVATLRLRFWQLAQWRQQTRDRTLSLFALVWLICVFLFFTIAVTKLPSYILPLMPAGAILTGLMWSAAMVRPGHQHSRKRRRWGLFLTFFAHLLFLGALAWALYYSPNWMGDDPDMVDLPVLIRQSHIMIIGALVWAGAAFVSLAILIARQWRWLWLVNGLAMLLFLLLTLLPAFKIVDTLRQQPLRDIATIIQQERQAGEPIIQVGIKPSLVFYTQQPIINFHSPEAATSHVQTQLQDSDPSLLLVGLQSRLQTLEIPNATATRLAEPGRYQLIRISARAPFSGSK